MNIAECRKVVAKDFSKEMNEIFDSLKGSRLEEYWERVAELYAQQSQGREWVAVEEDLPDHYRPIWAMYYVTDDYSNVPVLVWRSSDGDTDSYTIHGTDYILDGIVTFWQYAVNLPTPPKK